MQPDKPAIRAGLAWPRNLRIRRWKSLELRYTIRHAAPPFRVAVRPEVYCLSSGPTTIDDLVWVGAAELARRVAAGSTCATEIAEAHIERIEKINPAINSVVVRCFDRARRDAAEIDRRRSRGEPLGPLAGVPVTIKECFDVADTPATMGIARYAQEIATEDSPLVRRWSAAGAIVLGKTNVPQLMVIHETDNPLYGRTNNPWNLERSPAAPAAAKPPPSPPVARPWAWPATWGGASASRPIRSASAACCRRRAGSKCRGGGEISTGWNRSACSPARWPVRSMIWNWPCACWPIQLPRPTIRASRPTSIGDWRSVDVSRLRVGLVVDDGFFLPRRRSVERSRRRAEHWPGSAVGSSRSKFPSPTRRSSSIFT